jgi:hypothetical protein
MSKQSLPPPAPPELPPEPTPYQRLEARILELHKDIEAYIDTVVEREMAPGLPAVRIRHDLFVRAGFCHCVAAGQNRS